MKKILTFILLLLALSAGCLFPTLGTFAMSGMDSEMHQNMNNHMGSEIKMPCDSEDASVNMHECCESPFIDSIAYNRDSFFSDSEENDSSDIDGKIIYALYESLVSNNIHKLNSPPKYGGGAYITPSNTYIELTGIIKNNS